MFLPTIRFQAALCLAALVGGGFVAGIAGAEAKSKPPRLEFRILANEVDEPKVIGAAKKVFLSAKKDGKVKKELDRLAKEGKPPMPVTLGTDKAPGYTWVEIGPVGLLSMHLDEASATKEDFDQNWKTAAAARATGEAVTLKSYGEGCLLFSRPCLDANLPKAQRDRKKFDYFLLARDPQKGKALTGAHLVDAIGGRDERSHRFVSFKFSKEGGGLMFELTTANRPDQEGDPVAFHRCLAILVKGKVVSAPGLREPIKSKAMISGGFSREEIEELVKGLRLDIAAKKK